MRTHTLQNGNTFRADAFPAQEGEDSGDGGPDQPQADGDVIVLQNGNKFRASAFPEQEEPTIEAPARTATRKVPTWDLKMDPEHYLKQYGLDAANSALALASLGVTREEYEELQTAGIIVETTPVEEDSGGGKGTEE